MVISTPSKTEIMAFLRAFPNNLFTARDIAESMIERIPSYELTGATATIRARLEYLESDGKVYKRVFYTDNGKRTVLYGAMK